VWGARSREKGGEAGVSLHADGGAAVSVLTWWQLSSPSSGEEGSLQLADAPGLFGDDLDRGREERDREDRPLLAAALEGIPPRLGSSPEPSESAESATEGEAQCVALATGGAQEGAQRPS
jgi:hypothetical protein